jgi:GNAT superfamily N-acetyltransferase
MVTVTQAGPAERPLLIPLLREMSAFYAERRDDAVLAEAADALTSPAGRSGPFCLVALAHGTPSGFVSLCGFFPAFDFTWGLLLKDLFVAEASRGTGAARALMTAAAGFAASHGYTRIDWTTDGRNDRANAFYRKMGVPIADKPFYRVDGAILGAAARGAWPERIA